MNNIKPLRPFRFWAQNVIPLVYDESLSYYELLCKVIDYLNEMGVDFNELLENFIEFDDDMTSKFNNLSDDFDDLTDDFNDLKTWAEEEFPEFVNDKLDEMAENGTLTELIAPYLPFVLPELFGAKGDGVADDTEALQAACAQSVPVVFSANKTYAVSEQIEITAPALYGENCTIKILNDFTVPVFFSDNDIIIKGFNFDSNSHNVYYFIRVGGTDSGVEISNIYLANFNDTDNTNQSGLILCAAPQNVDISNIFIKNCTKKGNGTVGDGAGSIKGIYVVNPKANVNIHNVYIEELHSVDSNNDIIIEDADGVHVATDDISVNINIHDIYGKNYGKRLIKTQSVAPVYIKNVFAKSNGFDTVCAIGIGEPETPVDSLAFVEDCTFINTFVPSNSSASNYCVSSSQTCYISNCLFNTEKNFAILNTGKMSIKNCAINGMGIRDKTSKKTKIENSDIKGAYLYYGGTEILSMLNCSGEYISTSEVFNLVFPIFITVGSTRTGLFENCLFNNVKIRQSGGVYKSEKITNKDITYTNSDFSITLRDGASCSFNDLDYSKLDEQSAIIKMIDNPTGCLCELSKIRTTGFVRIAGGAGNYEVYDGVDITKLYKDQITAANIKNTPQWLDSAPLAGNLPDGIKYLNATDGKLYVVSSGTWVAVN